MRKEITVLSLSIFVLIPIPIVLAGEDEYEDDDRVGFGIMERTREHQDDREFAIGSDVGNVILYITILAIIASVGYTGFKLYKAKSKVTKK